MNPLSFCTLMIIKIKKAPKKKKKNYEKNLKKKEDIRRRRIKSANLKLYLVIYLVTFLVKFNVTIFHIKFSYIIISRGLTLFIKLASTIKFK